jgi:hypothetical protein
VAFFPVPSLDWPNPSRQRDPNEAHALVTISYYVPPVFTPYDWPNPSRPLLAAPMEQSPNLLLSLKSYPGFPVYEWPNPMVAKRAPPIVEYPNLLLTLQVGPGTTNSTTCGRLDAYDYLNGSIKLAWGAFGGTTPDSYNVYVNGVLNQNVLVRQAIVSGLTQAAYNPATGVLTPSGTYRFTVVAVIAGKEVAGSEHKRVTVSPSSIALVTPMKRLWPFPNSGID